MADYPGAFIVTIGYISQQMDGGIVFARNCILFESGSQVRDGRIGSWDEQAAMPIALLKPPEMMSQQQTSDYLRLLDSGFIASLKCAEYWRSPFEWKSSFTPDTWQSLQDVTTTKPHPLKISDLQLLCPVDVDQESFEPLIQIGRLLTTLRLEVTRRDGTLLDSILKVCPKLKELTVEFACSDETFY
ncbi:hypothetical protein BGW39_004802 [Mortierella sp. 14UC]|nr:hypothetical protein BGW39_004802 [Mortierella sp. 14UC]